MSTEQRRPVFAAKRVLAALSVIASAGVCVAVPPVAHAQTGAVWVIDDVTAKTTCTNTDLTPCPAGSVVVTQSHLIDLVAAQSSQRRYLRGDASATDLEAFQNSEADRYHRAAVARAQGSASLIHSGIGGVAHVSPRVVPASSRNLTRPHGLGSCPTSSPTTYTVNLGNVNLTGSGINGSVSARGCDLGSAGSHDPYTFFHAVASGSVWQFNRIPGYDNGIGQGFFEFGGGCKTITGSESLHWSATGQPGPYSSDFHPYAVYSNNSGCSGTQVAVNWYGM